MITISDETFSYLFIEAINPRHKKQLRHIRETLHQIVKEDKERKAEHASRHDTLCPYCNKVHNSWVICPEYAKASRERMAAQQQMAYSGQHSPLSGLGGMATAGQKQLEAVFRDALSGGRGIVRIDPQEFFKKPKRPNFFVWLWQNVKFAFWDVKLQGLKTDGLVVEGVR